VIGGVVQVEGRSIITGTSRAESNLKDHREKSRIVEGDQVFSESAGEIGGVIPTGPIAARSNSGEAFLSGIGEKTGIVPVLWLESELKVDPGAKMIREESEVLQRWSVDR
jgi:hypothetical protein